MMVQFKGSTEDFIPDKVHDGGIYDIKQCTINHSNHVRNIRCIGFICDDGRYGEVSGLKKETYEFVVIGS